MTTPQHTIYLSPQQVETIRNLPVFDGQHAVNVTMGDLFRGGEFAGFVVVSETAFSASGTMVAPDGSIR
jgi:hypothetical protein